MARVRLHARLPREPEVALQLPVRLHRVWRRHFDVVQVHGRRRRIEEQAEGGEVARQAHDVVGGIGEPAVVREDLPRQVAGDEVLTVPEVSLELVADLLGGEVGALVAADALDLAEGREGQRRGAFGRRRGHRGSHEGDERVPSSKVDGRRGWRGGRRRRGLGVAPRRCRRGDGASTRAAGRDRRGRGRAGGGRYRAHAQCSSFDGAVLDVIDV